MAELARAERKMQGASFKRVNTMSDKFQINRFRFVEFYCMDAIVVAKQLQFALGMTISAKSDLTTGNKKYASYVLKSNEAVFVISSPYPSSIDQEGSVEPYPNFTHERMIKFVNDHGLAVRTVSISVGDAKDAYEKSTANGAVGALPPMTLTDAATGTSSTISEIKMFGDVVIQWVSGDYIGPALPNYTIIDTSSSPPTCGLVRMDHIVSNVPNLFEALDYMMGAIGLHEFAEFTTEDVGTIDSGLNSTVLANNNEYVLLPINEPTHGTRRKSQIQTYLEFNNGPGVQHIAMKSEDIFFTLKEMRKRSPFGGCEFMPKPSSEYYKKVPSRIGEDILNKEQLAELEELGLLADKDDQGVLLQIFTKPLGDRPTFFIEVIQRIGCDVDFSSGEKKEQSAGCGGFGKGNFSELFKSIEDFERQFDKK